jgi:hypothetical protein
MMVNAEMREVERTREDSCDLEELFVEFVVVAADVDEFIDSGGAPGGFAFTGGTGDEQMEHRVWRLSRLWRESRRFRGRWRRPR